MPSKKSEWVGVYLGTKESRETCKSFFGLLADDNLTPYKAEILCEIATDREKKIRAFMKDETGSAFKFERTFGRNFIMRRTALASDGEKLAP